MALDKTGTITKGEPVVTDILPAEGVTEEDLLVRAAALESRSEHPLAKAIISFADQRAERTMIARLDRHDYLILTVTREKKKGLSLRRAEEFFRENFSDAEWVYNLDGGPSSALLCRAEGKKKPKTVAGGTAKVADILAFVE